MLGNVGTEDGVPLLEAMLQHDDPPLREHATWALARDRLPSIGQLRIIRRGLSDKGLSQGVCPLEIRVSHASQYELIAARKTARRVTSPDMKQFELRREATRHSHSRIQASGYLPGWTGVLRARSSYFTNSAASVRIRGSAV